MSLTASLRAYLYRGRHRRTPCDALPVGQVWFHGGTWWTACRSYAWRVERHFDRRSNPLDHEWSIEQEVVRLRKARFTEKEY